MIIVLRYIFSVCHAFVKKLIADAGIAYIVIPDSCEKCSCSNMPLNDTDDILNKLPYSLSQRPWGKK